MRADRGLAIATAAGALAALSPTPTRAAEAPDLAAGGYVVYVAELGTGRGCAIDGRLAARLRVARKRTTQSPTTAPSRSSGSPTSAPTRCSASDPETERFQAFRIPTTDALVRQIVAVDGVIWGAESATEKLVAYRAG